MTPRQDSRLVLGVEAVGTSRGGGSQGFTEEMLFSRVPPLQLSSHHPQSSLQSTDVTTLLAHYDRMRILQARDNEMHAPSVRFPRCTRTAHLATLLFTFARAARALSNANCVFA